MEDTPQRDQPSSTPAELSSAQLLERLGGEDYQGSQLLDILSQLNEVVDSARNLPMSASVLVNRAQLRELLDSASGAIPADVQAAHAIVTGAEAVVARAREESGALLALAGEEAERIVADAHAQAERLVAGERIAVMAGERAAQLIEQAESRAQQLAAGANSYCDRQLADLEAEFEKYAAQARAGREVLSQRSLSPPEPVVDSSDSADSTIPAGAAEQSALITDSVAPGPTSEQSGSQPDSLGGASSAPDIEEKA